MSDSYFAMSNQRAKQSTYIGNDGVLAMRYNVWISGTFLDVDRKQCIEAVELKETVDGADTATLRIADPDFLFINDNIFIEDNSIKIEMGWEGETYRERFMGYISAIDIVFSANGFPVISLMCMDRTHLMNRERKNQTYTNCTSVDVVKKIVQSYGYKFEYDKEVQYKVQETITQSDQTDIEFICNLASQEVHPFTARLVGDTFYYVTKGKLDTPKLTLHYVGYPHEIISFSPRINKEMKKEAIESSASDTGTKTFSTTKASIPVSEGSISSSENRTAPPPQQSNSSGHTFNPVNRGWA